MPNLAQALLHKLCIAAVVIKTAYYLLFFAGKNVFSPKKGVVNMLASSSCSLLPLPAGFMPAKMTLFDANCKPVYDLGNGPYNIARWNPFGRFFIVAGFGNLPGECLVGLCLRAG